MLHVLITIWIAVIGLCVGSFLNVVIGRLPFDEENFDEPTPVGFWQHVASAFRFSGRAYRRLYTPPHSHCPKCGHQIRWFENIPVVSWLALRGKCSNCKQPISPRYILVELLTGTLFVAMTTRYPFDWQLVSALTFLTFLIPLIFIDAEHWILPFELTLPGIAGGILLALPQGHDAFVTAVLGAGIAFLAFRVMEFLGWTATGREALGAGDKYLLAMIGAQVGWRALLGVVLLSSLQGAIVGIIRMRMTGRAGPSSPPEPKPEAPAQDKPVELVEAVTDSKPDETEEEVPSREPFTPEFIKPGYAWCQRVLLVPYTVLLQDIPDSPPPDEATGEIPDWEPGANNIPFGPWIGLAGIEVMLLGPWVVDALARTPYRLLAEIVFGQ